jgi:hypothetical protein
MFKIKIFFLPYPLCYILRYIFFLRLFFLAEKFLQTLCIFAAYMRGIQKDILASSLTSIAFSRRTNPIFRHGPHGPSICRISSWLCSKRKREHFDTFSTDSVMSTTTKRTDTLQTHLQH